MGSDRWTETRSAAADKVDGHTNVSTAIIRTFTTKSISLDKKTQSPFPISINPLPNILPVSIQPPSCASQAPLVLPCCIIPLALSTFLQIAIYRATLITEDVSAYPIHSCRVRVG